MTPSFLLGLAIAMPFYSTGDGTLLPETQELIRHYSIANPILFNWSNPELSSPELTKKLVHNIHTFIQKELGVTPIIMIDQEGGCVRRCQWPPFDKMVSAQEQDEKNSAHEWGTIAGKTFQEMGINCVLAPSVDLRPDMEKMSEEEKKAKKNFVTRCYNSNAQKVQYDAEGFLKGLSDHNVLGCLKHFLGHGQVVGDDSHLGLPTYPYSLEEWQNSDGLPYYKLASKTPMIMMGHIAVPFLGSHTPASLLPAAYNLLRNTVQFKGTIITDSLTMYGAAGKYNASTAATQIAACAITSLQAGADILLFGQLQLDKENPLEANSTPQEVLAIFGKILQQIKNNAIALPPERITEAVARVSLLRATLQPLVVK